MTAVLRTLYRTFGARGIALRATHELRRRARLFARAPRHDLDTLVAPPSGWPFTIDRAAIAEATDRPLALERADRVAAGEYQAFGREWLPLPATPGSWSRHPHTGHRYPDSPWWTVPLLGSAGDVKDVWEPARFGWVYDLVRGHAVSGDARYADAFWRTLESFATGCPPMTGVQWACGQETAIRAVALLWAEAAFSEAPATTAARRALLERILHASGERITDAIGYAVSQRNNHAISEAVGLVALGARFAGGSPAAAAWYRRGRALLPRLVHDQVAPDGWYIQHSFTYARLALDMLVTGIRVLGSAGDRLPAATRDRVAAAARLLSLVTDPATGDVPNHGPNDGAHVLPLGTGGYRDFRPALTAIFSALDLPLPAPLQSREALAWLATQIRTAPAEASRDRVVTGSSGWVLAHRGDVRVFARAGSYAGRPGHIDPLHVEIWAGSRPVAIDAGTFRYNAPPPWGHALEDTRVHNTVTLPRFPAARRGPRFLWLSTPAAAVESVQEHDSTTTIRLSHRSWAPSGIVHRRTIDVTSDRVIVLDEIDRRGADTSLDAELHWLCDVRAHTRPAVTATPAGTLHERCGDETDVRGWQSLYYGSREPARSLTCAARAEDGRLRFRTVFDLSPDLPSPHE